MSVGCQGLHRAMLLGELPEVSERASQDALSGRVFRTVGISTGCPLLQPSSVKGNLSAVMMAPHWGLEECAALGLKATARIARDLLASSGVSAQW